MPSTSGTTSSRWSTRLTAPRKATSAARCARPCRTRSCSALQERRSTGATATRSPGSAPRRTQGGYLSRYSMQDSIRDGATLPLHFEPRLSEIHIDADGIDAAFEELSQQHDLTDDDKIKLSQRAASIEALIKAEDRVRKIAADIADHFQQKVDPEGLKAQVVVYDKPTCVAYKAELDKHLPAEASTVVMSKSREDPPEWAPWTPGRDDLEAITARFNDPADPLKIIIVTAKLLTGFDAPILYAQYLDKPLKEHTLLQAITRTNRVYPGKTHGLVVDYLGVFDNVARAFKFDESTVKQIITNIAELKAQLKPAIDKALAFFPGVDRTVGGYDGLIQAQAAIADDAQKDAFGLAYSVVSQLWEAISPDPMLSQHEADYRWLSDVYESVRPSDITGRLVWHALGAKTLDLINQHVQVEVPRTDLEIIVLDAAVLDDLLAGKTDPVEIEKQITGRIARHLNNPVFQAARPTPERAAGALLRYPAEQPGVPAGAAATRPGHGSGGEADRTEAAGGAGQGRADRTVRGPPGRRHPGHRREHRQPHRRGRPQRALHGLAEHQRGRPACPAGPSQDALHPIQDPEPGRLREGSRLRPRVLLKQLMLTGPALRLSHERF